MPDKLLPAIPGFFPDPSICRVGEDIFLVCSSCEYFPGVPVFHSRDLRRWKQIGHVLDRSSQLDLSKVGPSDGIYAPSIRYIEGRFYMITTLVRKDRSVINFFVTTKDPFGSWSDPIWMPEVSGIDPDFFQDNDGTVYLQWSWKDQMGSWEGITIGQARLDLETGSLLEKPRDLWRGTGGLGPEGPRLFRRGDWYYLCIAEGGTEYGHMQTIARSRKATGPFEACPRNPVLTHRSSGSSVQAVGHADLMELPNGEWVGVAHGIRPKGYPRFHVLGREIFVYPVRWDAEGWPVFGDGGMLPPMNGGQVSPTDFHDHFETSTYPLEWAWLGNPREAHYLRRGDGQLSLLGSGDELGRIGHSTWIGVRQRDHACRARAALAFKFKGEADGDAGLCVFQNQHHFASLGLSRHGAGTFVMSRIRLNEVVMEKDHGPLPNDLAEWEIQAESFWYRLGFRDSEGRFRELDRIEARFLSTEVSGRFTGAFFALYALGSGELECSRFGLVHPVAPGCGYEEMPKP